MMLVPSYVAPSRIAGVGVFAKEPISKGMRLWQMHPRIDLFFTAAEVEAMPSSARDFFQTYAYPDTRRPAFLIYNSDNGRFMNHSDRPNTNFTSFDAGYAIAQIEAGEEITCNYTEFQPGFDGSFTA